MGKVNRQDQNENYKITAPWLYEFAYDLEKEGNRLDYLKQYFDSREQRNRFQSIDEKLTDIKSRVGFDLAHKISEEVNKTDKVSASDFATDVNSVKHAHYQHPKEDVEIMCNVLNYALEMIKDQKHLDAATVLSELREVEGLRINEIKLNVCKFLDFLGEKIAEIHKESFEPVEYIPSEPLGVGESDDYKAEYYNHAEPSSSV
jgi:hypothetical protein